MITKQSLSLLEHLDWWRDLQGSEEIQKLMSLLASRQKLRWVSKLVNLLKKN